MLSVVVLAELLQKRFDLLLLRQIRWSFKQDLQVEFQVGLRKLMARKDQCVVFDHRILLLWNAGENVHVSQHLRSLAFKEFAAAAYEDSVAGKDAATNIVDNLEGVVFGMQSVGTTV